MSNDRLIEVAVSVMTSLDVDESLFTPFAASTLVEDEVVAVADDELDMLETEETNNDGTT